MQTGLPDAHGPVGRCVVQGSAAVHQNGLRAMGMAEMRRETGAHFAASTSAKNEVRREGQTTKTAGPRRETGGSGRISEGEKTRGRHLRTRRRGG